MWLVVTAWVSADTWHLWQPPKDGWEGPHPENSLGAKRPFLSLFTASEIITPLWGWRELGLLVFENFLGAEHPRKMWVPQICDTAQGISNLREPQISQWKPTLGFYPTKLWKARGTRSPVLAAFTLHLTCVAWQSYSSSFMGRCVCLSFLMTKNYRDSENLSLLLGQSLKS